MSLIIQKETNTDNLKNLLGGDFPEYHPESYIKIRVQQGFAFTAFLDQQLAGFGIYSIWWGNCPHVELIKVSEDFQRQGIGKALLSKIKEEVKKQGFDKLISSTEAINEMGQKFHEHEGFKRLSSLHLPHGEEIFYEIDL